MRLRRLAGDGVAEHGMGGGQSCSPKCTEYTGCPAVAEDLLWPTMAAAIPKILKSTYHSVQHKRKGDGADHSLQIILLFFLSPLRFLLFFYISAIPGFTVVLRH